MTSTIDEDAWTARVQELCQRAGQPPVTVEFADGTGEAGKYFHRPDVVRLRRGWCADAGCPDGPAGSWMIAHELGHRAEREDMERSGRLAIIGALLAPALAAAVGLSVWWAGASPTPAVGATLGMIALLYALLLRLQHPAEFRADDFAADLIGDPTATEAALSVIPRDKWSDRVAPGYPTRTRRIARQAKRFAAL